MSVNVSAVALAALYFVVAFAVVGVVEVNKEVAVDDLVFLEGKIVNARDPFYGLKYRPYYPYEIP